MEQRFKQFIIFFRCHNEKYLEENTIELICGFVWSSLIPVSLTLLLQFNGMFTRKRKERKKDILLALAVVRSEINHRQSIFLNL